jgi:hypothetical protein
MRGEPTETSGARRAVARQRVGRAGGGGDVASGRGLPGDDVVGNPMAEATTAAAIEASPAAVWPWLVQIGYGRAGWYSYDWLANRGQRSAERILAQYQRLRPGDVLPERRENVATPQGYDVHVVDPPRALVLARTRDLLSGAKVARDLGWRPDAYATISRAWLLEGSLDDRCRLIARTRMEFAPAWLGPLVRLVVVPAERLMQRKQLVEIKRRAESRAAAEPHGFKGAGDDTLRVVSVHPSGSVEQTNLEPSPGRER